jgi:hypothetical protein
MRKSFVLSVRLKVPGRTFRPVCGDEADGWWLRCATGAIGRAENDEDSSVAGLLQFLPH